MFKFVVVLIFLITCSDAQNSCESLVKYSKDGAAGEGLITIPTPKISEHEVKVKFTIDSRLKSSFVGNIALTKSAEEAVKDIRQGQPLSYRVQFPPGGVSPKIVSVRYNDREICADGLEKYQTLVTLTHQLDTGVKFENENVEDAPRADYRASPKVTIPPRVATPTQASVQKPKDTAFTNAQTKGSDLLQKIASGEFKTLAVINPQELMERNLPDLPNSGVVESYNNIKNKYTSSSNYAHNKKDVDLTLKIPGNYIENAVVAIVISVADTVRGQENIIYQNLLNKS